MAVSAERCLTMPRSHRGRPVRHPWVVAFRHETFVVPPRRYMKFSSKPGRFFGSFAERLELVSLPPSTARCCDGSRGRHAHDGLDMKQAMMLNSRATCAQIWR